MARKGMEVVVSKLPECDIHKYVFNTPGVEAHYDAKTNDGRWAYLCEEHFVSHAMHEELGTGMGQKLILKSNG